MVSEKLLNFIRRYHHQPYSLGHNDCFLFALRWADHVRGEAVRDQYRYVGDRGAVRILRERGVRECWEFIDRHYPRSHDHAGAIVAWTGEHFGSCGVSLGDGHYATITQTHGLDYTDDRPDYFWSVISG